MKVLLTQSEIHKALTVYMKAVKGKTVTGSQFRFEFRNPDIERRLMVELEVDESKQSEPLIWEETTGVLTPSGG